MASETDEETMAGRHGTDRLNQVLKSRKITKEEYLESLSGLIESQRKKLVERTADFSKNAGESIDEYSKRLEDDKNYEEEVKRLKKIMDCTIAIMKNIPLLKDYIELEKEGRISRYRFYMNEENLPLIAGEKFVEEAERRKDQSGSLYL